MNTLMTQIHELRHVAHELLYLGADGSPIYTDSFRQLNTEVLQKSDALFALKGENPEEEARLWSLRNRLFWIVPCLC